MNSVVISVPTGQVREFYTSSVRRALRDSVSPTFVSAENDVFKFPNIFIKNIIL
jgi:hypothetical protein